MNKRILGLALIAIFAQATVSATHEEYVSGGDYSDNGACCPVKARRCCPQRRMSCPKRRCCPQRRTCRPQRRCCNPCDTSYSRPDGRYVVVDEGRTSREPMMAERTETTTAMRSEKAPMSASRTTTSEGMTSEESSMEEEMPA